MHLHVVTHAAFSFYGCGPMMLCSYKLSIFPLLRDTKVQCWLQTEQRAFYYMLQRSQTGYWHRLWSIFSVSALHRNEGPQIISSPIWQWKKNIENDSTVKPEWSLIASVSNSLWYENDMMKERNQITLIQYFLQHKTPIMRNKFTLNKSKLFFVICTKLFTLYRSWIFSSRFVHFTPRNDHKCCI